MNIALPAILLTGYLILSLVYPRTFIMFGMTQDQIDKEGGFLIIIYGWGGLIAFLGLWLMMEIDFL